MKNKVTKAHKTKNENQSNKVIIKLSVTPEIAHKINVIAKHYENKRLYSLSLEKTIDSFYDMIVCRLRGQFMSGDLSATQYKKILGYSPSKEDYEEKKEILAEADKDSVQILTKIKEDYSILEQEDNPILYMRI